MKSYLFLLFAIIFEITGTTFLKKTEQFTKPVPTLIFICSLATSFYLLTYALKGIPLGITYAIWSGAGIMLISLIGYLVYKQSLDLPAIIGVSFIVVGVIIINLFSKATVH